MAHLMKPQPVQLLVGLIYGSGANLEEIESGLAREFGEIEIKSPSFDFDVTDYYEAEMGSGLRRLFYGFKKLIDPGDIVDIKLTALRIEEDTGREGARTVNLDPGYMDFNKFILVSGKFLAQKVYLTKGVYADPTIYYDKGWKVYDWAFPDFKSGRYNEFFTEVRKLYKAKMRRLGGKSPTGMA